MTDLIIEEELVAAGSIGLKVEEQEDRESNPICDHAGQRMGERGISNEAVFQVIAFGRIQRGRGATVYAIGKKEIKELLRQRVDLREYEGIHVVTRRDGTVVTAYRNRSMPPMRPMSRRVFRQDRRRGLRIRQRALLVLAYFQILAFLVCFF